MTTKQLCALRWPLLAPVLAALMIAGSPGEARAQDDRQPDRVFFEAGSEPPQYGWGRVGRMTIEGIEYEHLTDRNRRETLEPWRVRWIQFGDAGIPNNWREGVASLRNENYRNAVVRLEAFENQTFREHIPSEQRRINVTWATHYYLGRAYYGAAQSIERAAERLVVELRDEQANERVVARDLRGRVERAMSDIAQRAEDLVDERFNVARDALLSALAEASDKADFVRESFRQAVTAYGRAAAAMPYEKAAQVLNHMFVSPPDSNRFSFSQTSSFWMFEMKYWAAQALRGAGRFAEALSELDSRINNGAIMVRGERQQIPQRTAAQVANNPELVLRASALAREQPGYLHYVARARNLTAEIFIAAGDFEGAMRTYALLRTLGDNRPEFLAVRNQADLDYGFTLSLVHGYERAREHLMGIASGFEAVNDDAFDPTFVIDDVDAQKYAGAYMGLGDLALREYERATSARDRLAFRQQALEAYNRVLAFFSVDGNSRARALYQASRLYRDIANEWERTWANRPRTDEDGTVTNPYYYYLDLSERLRRELVERHGNSPYAQTS